jgi:hypothetical protein
VTHYSDKPGHVLVQRFRRDGGKWYDNFQIDMSDHYHCVDMHKCIAGLIVDALHSIDTGTWIYVVAEPYNIHAHPQMIKRIDLK